MGVLKAKVGGVWQEIPMVGGGGIAEEHEVYSGATEPTDALAELWIDTSTAPGSVAPVGLIGYGFAPSSQAIQQTVVDITGCSVTFNADPTHTYKVTLFVPRFDQTVAAGVLNVYITNAAGTAYVGSALTIAAGAYAHAIVQHVLTGLSGSTTLKGRASNNAGTSTTAGFVPFMLVEDITTVRTAASPTVPIYDRGAVGLTGVPMTPAGNWVLMATLAVPAKTYARFLTPFASFLAAYSTTTNEQVDFETRWNGSSLGFWRGVPHAHIKQIPFEVSLSIPAGQANTLTLYAREIGGSTPGRTPVDGQVGYIAFPANVSLPVGA